MRRLVSLVALLLAFAVPALAASPKQSGFVRVEGTRFVIDGKPYRFAGANFWYGAYLGAPDATGDRARLRAELDQLKAAGIDNLRVLAMSEASGFKRGVRPAFMARPGEYDERLLQGLDYLLAEMARRDMKAVLYLNNFWQWSGGMAQYVNWATGEPLADPDASGDWNGFMQYSARFYALPEAQRWYRDAIRKLIERRNSINGIEYANDPTVMSWQLANEPRPGGENGGRAHFAAYRAWIDDTAGFIRKLAPKQLVSTGSEGSWGSLRDDDLFLVAHASHNIDYLTVHLWPSNWGWIDHKDPAARLESGLEKSLAYIDRHVDMAGKLGMPIVLEEFGLNRDQGAFDAASGVQARDRFYAAVYARVLERAKQGDAIAGSNFWAWGGRGRAAHADFWWKPGDAFTGDPPQEAQGLFSLFDSDASTLRIVSGHARAMRELPSSAAEPAVPLRVATYAYPQRDRIAAITPLATYLSRRSGRNTTVTLYPSPTALVQALLDGRVDVAVPNLHGFLQAQADSNVQALPVPEVPPAQADRYRAVLLARHGLTTSEQLRRDAAMLRLTLVGRDSASGGFVPVRHLRALGLEPTTSFKSLAYAGSHVAALAALVEDRADVVALAADVFDAQRPANVHELWRSPPIPPGPLLCRDAGAPCADIGDWLLQAESNAPGVMAALRVGWPEFGDATAFKAADLRVYSGLSTD